MAFQPEDPDGVVDARGRFREIFCTVTREHGAELPDYRGCEASLLRTASEPAGTGEAVALGASEMDFLALMVPGLAWECVRDWLDFDRATPEHVSRYGYELDLLEVAGLDGTEANALLIRDYVLSMPPERAGKPLVLIGYSKGAPDVLEALVRYPEVAERVVAVVSFAGAVGGSPLVNDAPEWTLGLFKLVPGSDCDEGDGQALTSLSPAVRRAWLEENQLPDHIRYYSVVAFPDPEVRISGGLKAAWRKLGRLEDARNDSQLVFYDQVIPGSKLLALANADHWAMAVPVARHHPFAASTYANRNDFPREVMLESLLRFIEEDLAANKVPN
jgi:hypothetical protein